VPMLAPVAAAGNSSSPLMTLRWFCPPYGIERFEVSIALEGGGDPGVSLGTALLPKLRDDENVPYPELDSITTDRFAVHLTRRVGADFGEGADFRVSVPVEANRPYHVYIKAVGLDGRTSGRSLVRTFSWDGPFHAAPEVPWPARPLPPINATAKYRSTLPLPTSGIVATNLVGTEYPLGVRIGDVTGILSQDADTGTRIAGAGDPVRFLYVDERGSNVFPLVLYRFQVPNTNFPFVSGDLVQVSPLLERLAFERDTAGSIRLRDPFVSVQRPSPSVLFGLYALDTQPALMGARYAYLLVRLDPRTREIAEVLPTGEVEL
jgi:hypothetical protein